jgi:MFS family permease
VGALIGALLVAAYGHLVTPRKLAFGGVYLFSAAVITLAFTRSFYFSLGCLFLSGFGMLLFFATSNTTLQTIVPDEMRGRVMGIWSLVFGMMIPVGSIEAGAVANLFGTPFALGLGAIICLAAAIITRIVIARREALATT